MKHHRVLSLSIILMVILSCSNSGRAQQAILSFFDNSKVQQHVFSIVKEELRAIKAISGQVIMDCKSG